MVVYYFFSNHPYAKGVRTMNVITKTFFINPFATGNIPIVIEDLNFLITSPSV